MWLESELGVGSTFGFTVPIGTPKISEGTPLTTPEALRTPRVMVVEDDSRSVDLLTVYLESAGFDVSSERDGPSGLEATRRLKPVAVVLDIRLPRMDGWDVLAALKADPDTAAIPVVIVSVLDERVKGLSLGAADYLLKPISREAILDALARAGVRSEPLGTAAPELGSEHR
jgi:DNA-binding response OmpR family regulator